jgi:hypothetical protein
LVHLARPFSSRQFLFNGHELLDLFARRSLSVDEMNEVVQEQNMVIDTQNERISRIEAALAIL